MEFPAPPESSVGPVAGEDLPSQSVLDAYGDGEDDTPRPVNGGATVEGVRCPVAGCEYTGQPASVAAHVSGTHDWDRLGDDGAREFKDEHG